MRKLKLVAIGGGNGTTQVIRAAKPYFSHLSAIISVTDCGRSTGVARGIGKIPAPGDIRNTIASLAYDPNDLLVKLLQYRFDGERVKELEGMAVGNLVLAALSQMTGSFSKAVEELQKMVGCVAKVYPVSDVDTDLCAELEDGSITRNELETRGVNKSPIKKLFLAKSPAPAYRPALDAICDADLIVIGPGSFYTSVMAALIFDGVRDSIRVSAGKVVYIANTTTQPGQTDGFSSFDYVNKMNEFLGEGVLDYALVNKSDHLNEETQKKYAADGIVVLSPTEEDMRRFEGLSCKIFVEDFAESAKDKREIWNKLDTVRHDHAKMGEFLSALVQ